ncbi:unnamed protein product, partial [Effrenium voratum]
SYGERQILGGAEFEDLAESNSLVEDSIVPTSYQGVCGGDEISTLMRVPETRVMPWPKIFSVAELYIKAQGTEIQRLEAELASADAEIKAASEQKAATVVNDTEVRKLIVEGLSKKYGPRLSVPQKTMLYYYHDSTLASARHFCLRELSGCVWWLNPAAVAAEDSGEPEMKREKAAGQQAASNKVKACGDNQRRDREEADSENAAQLKAPPERRRKRSPCSGQPRAKAMVARADARQLKLGQRSLAGVADDELCEADTGDEQSTPCAAALVATGVDEDFRVATSCPWQKIAPGALWPVNFFVQIPCIAALQPRACAC